MYKILKVRQLTPITRLYVVDAPLVARSAQPGQFIILRVGESGERIPVTITDFDREAGTVTIVVQAVGKTTHWLSVLNSGETIQDFFGPLGSPVPLPEAGKVVLVGGGFGTAAILTIAKELRRRPAVSTTAIVGARHRELLILSDEVGAQVDRFLPCTDDGSLGFHGFVSGRLEELLVAGEGFDLALAIGPMPMMRGIAGITRPYGIRTLASMDPLMLDGTGMCGACRVRVEGENRFACVDGPFFNAHHVDFDEVARRNKVYHHHERAALDRYLEQARSCHDSVAD